MIRSASNSSAARFWIVLLLAIAVLRSPGFVFGGLNVDEIEFALIGQVIARGGLDYVDVVEPKPPLLHLLFVPAAIGGSVSLWPMRLLAILFLLGTSWLLGLAARRWTE